MAIGDTPQTEETKRKVAPNVVARRRPFRVRGGGVTIPTSDTSAQDRFLGRRVAEITDERQEYEGLLKSTFSNKLRDLNNKSLEKVMVAEGVTSQKEWAKAQEHRQKELEELTFGFNADEKALISPLAERSTVDFMGTGSRHVANEMHKAGIKEYQKALAGEEDDSTRISATYIGQGRTKSDFYKRIQDFYNNKGEAFNNTARLAKMKGYDLNTIKEQKKALITSRVVKAIDYNIGNGQYDNAKAIFDDMKKFIDPDAHAAIQKRLDVGEELNRDDRAYAISQAVRRAYPDDLKKQREALHSMTGGDGVIARKAIGFLNMDAALIKKEKEEIKHNFNVRTFQNNQTNYNNKVPFNVAHGQMIRDGMASGVSGDEIRKQSKNLKDLYDGKRTFSNPQEYRRLRRMMYLNPAQFKKEPIAELINDGKLSFRDGQEFLARQTEAWRDDKKPPPPGVMEKISELIDDVVDDSGAEAEQANEMYINLWNSVDRHRKDGNLGDVSVQQELVRQLTEMKESQPGFWEVVGANLFRGLSDTPALGGKFVFGGIADYMAADINRRSKQIANADITVYRYIGQANKDPKGKAVINAIMARWAKTQGRLPTDREMNNALYEYYSTQEE